MLANEQCYKHKYLLLKRRNGYVGSFYVFGCGVCGKERQISVIGFWS